jgi:hypothetical protein
MKNTTTTPETFPAVTPGLEQCHAAKYQDLIRAEIPNLAPELPEIVRLSEREAQILEAAEQFSQPAAREDYERETSTLRADPTPGNLERLKNIGSIAERIDNYHRQHRALEADAVKLRKQAAPLIKAASARLITRLGEKAEQAAREEAELIVKWGIPATYESRTRPHFVRAQQELARHVLDQDADRHFSPISRWLARFI